MEDFSYGERLDKQDLFSLEPRRLKVDLLEVYKIMWLMFEMCCRRVVEWDTFVKLDKHLNRQDIKGPSVGKYD